MDQQLKKIIIMYHFPCFDGIFSSMNLALIIKSKLLFDGQKIDQIFQNLCQQKDKGERKTKLLEDQIEHNFFTFNPEDDIMYQYINFQQHLNQSFQPIKIGEETNESLIVLQQNFQEQMLKSSILIILDYFGRSKETIEKLSNLMEKVIIIDHHQSAINILIQFPQYKEQEKKLQQISQNVFVLVDTSEAATLLTVRFCQEVFNQSFIELVPKNIFRFFDTFNKYISDHDLYEHKYQNSEAISSALHQQKFDLNILTNPLIFYQLFQIDEKIYIRKGELILKQRAEKINLIINKKHLVKINGYKCYGIACQDKSLINELGQKLSEFSINDGFENMAVVYFINYNWNGKNIKFHLRAVQDKNPVRCDLVAESFGGGGHSCSSAFNGTQKTLQKFKKCV